MGKPKLQPIPRLPESGTFPRASRCIVTRPDPVLEEPCVAVNPYDRSIVELAAAMVSTMRSTAGCQALSAPQLGELVRVVCTDIRGLLVLVNPVILKRRGTAIMREECLSIPNAGADVARAAAVLVAGFEPGTGRVIRLATNGLEARCIQHEIDHLDGVSFIERT
jgi:peptide deformylase